jgi:hypothetical protein
MTAFVTARAAVEPLGLSAFVRAGHAYVDDTHPVGLTVTPAGQTRVGYDGQFMYRLAVSPLSNADRAGGVTFDQGAYRQQRVAYPAAAWAISAGNPRLAPLTLVVVNVAALAALAFFGALLALRFGRNAYWGFAFAAWPGLIMSLSFDLAEPVAAAALAAGIVAVVDRRWVWAAAAFTLAALARETAIVVPLALGAVWFARRTVPLIVAAVPALVFFAWQYLIAQQWGVLAVREGSGNVGAPFVGAAHFLTHRSGLFPELFDRIGFAELAILAGIVVAAVASSRRAPLELVVPFIAAAVIPICATALVWQSPWHWLRATTEMFVLALAVLIASGRHRLPAAATLAVWPVGVYQILSLM